MPSSLRLPPVSLLNAEPVCIKAFLLQEACCVVFILLSLSCVWSDFAIHGQGSCFYHGSWTNQPQLLK
jgi:hypothetical protein